MLRTAAPTRSQKTFRYTVGFLAGIGAFATGSLPVAATIAGLCYALGRAPGVSREIKRGEPVFIAAYAAHWEPGMRLRCGDDVLYVEEVQSDGAWVSREYSR